MNHQDFSTKVKAQLKAAGYSQKVLAIKMGRDPSVLTHKLNGTGRTVLTFREIHEIIKHLAILGAISRRDQVNEFLKTASCPNFQREEWARPPLNQLEEAEAV